MSDDVPGDYVAFDPEGPPGAPKPEYLPPPGEARDRVYAGHSKRMADWAGYMACYARDYSAKKNNTARLIGQRRSARRKR